MQVLRQVSKCTLSWCGLLLAVSRLSCFCAKNKRLIEGLSTACKAQIKHLASSEGVETPIQRV